MKKTISLLLSGILCLPIPVMVYSQNTQLDALNGIATQYYNTFVNNEQSIWTHLDKSIYTPGSDIWFSLYLVRGANYAASSSDKIVYAELVNQNDSAVKYVILKNQGISLAGKIKIPDTIPQGMYRFRAYSKNSIEKKPAQLIETIVYIMGPAVSTVPEINFAERIYAAKKTSSLQFDCYPEGGNIISGVSNTIVVRVFDSEGKPVQVKGVFTNSVDTSAIPFETNEWGVGAAQITAIKNRKYKATIQYKGQFFEKTIPASPVIAWQLSVVQQTKNMVKLRISLSDSLYKIKPDSYLLGIGAGKICFAATGRGMFEVEVPLSNFPYGIASFLLYDSQKKLVSKRSVFIQEEAIKVTLVPNQKKYDPREWVKLDLLITDNSLKPVKSNFSITVTDDSYITAPPEDSLLRFRLLLKDWLGDKPICSEQLVRLTDDSKSLDRIMICTDKETPTTLVADSVSGNPIEILYLKGRALNKKKEPLANHIITVLYNQGGSFIKTTTTDSSGSFTFPLPDFFGTTLFNFQVSNTNNTILKDVILTIHEPSPPVWKQADFIPCKPVNLHWEEINQFKKGIDQNMAINKKVKLLKEVTVSGYYKSFNDIINTKRVNKSSWIGTPEMLDQVGEGNVSNVVLRAPGVMLMGGFVTIQGGIRGISGVVNAAVEPLVIVNGVQVNVGGSSDIGLSTNISPVLNFLNTFSARNIDFIEVLTGPQGAQYGTVGGNGVILIYTNANPRTGIAEKDNASGMYPHLVNGYQVPEVFTGPDYAEKQTKANYIPDNRTTLYWNGQSGTDSTGKTTIRFYSSDLPGPYTVIIRGIAEDGSLFSKRFKLNYELRKP